MPDKICLSCSDKLQKAYEIISLFHENERVLRKQVVRDHANSQLFIIKTEENCQAIRFEDSTSEESKDVPQFPDVFEVPLIDPLLENQSNVRPDSRSKSDDTNKSRTFCEICGKYYARAYIRCHEQTVHQNRNAELSNYKCKFLRNSTSKFILFPKRLQVIFAGCSLLSRAT